MSTTVEIITPFETLALHPTPDITGLVYDNATLDAWYAIADVEAPADKRPNAHGSYGLGQTYTTEHKPIVKGQYYGTGPTDALVMRQRLAAAYNDGKPITLRVTDELGPTTREAWLVDFDAPFRYGFDHFTFDIVFVAPDPRRYGPLVTITEGLPTVGGGLFWNLGLAPSTLFFDWGLFGSLGQISFTNTGASVTFPTIEVGGPGTFDVGFRVTEIETGYELEYSRPTSFGEVVVLNSRTGRATIAGGQGDVTKWLTARDWFSIAPGATHRYQIASLGSVSGAPTMTASAAAAYL